MTRSQFPTPCGKKLGGEGGGEEGKLRGGREKKGRVEGGLVFYRPEEELALVDCFGRFVCSKMKPLRTYL
jgi:hypothetical protein